MLYYKHCLNTNTAVFDALENTVVSWYCCNYGIPQFNSSLFYEDPSTDNDTNDSLSSNLSRIGPPLSQSSPTVKLGHHAQFRPITKRRLRVISVNFQSIKAKRELFWSLLKQTNPDIILASETWLHPGIHDCEVLPDNYTLTDYQHSFRRNRSCEAQLINTIQDLAAGMDKSTQIDAILHDFLKAFGKVPHQRLRRKLHHYGVRASTLRWIQSFLGDRTQRVVVDGESSTTAAVTSWVPKGTVLGPLLFLVYINDLPSRVKATARLFADDCLLYRTVNSSDDAASLQQDLDNLQYGSMHGRCTSTLRNVRWSILPGEGQT